MEDNKDVITIDIPVYYLIQFAVSGNMGTGNLPDLIKVWAQRILREKGYSDLLKEEQKQNLEKLRKSLSNVVGKENMEKIDNAISDAKIGLQFATELNKGKLQ